MFSVKFADVVHDAVQQSILGARADAFLPRGRGGWVEGALGGTRQLASCAA